MLDNLNYYIKDTIVRTPSSSALTIIIKLFVGLDYIGLWSLKCQIYIHMYMYIFLGRKKEKNWTTLLFFLSIIFSNRKIALNNFVYSQF